MKFLKIVWISKKILGEGWKILLNNSEKGLKAFGKLEAIIIEIFCENGKQFRNNFGDIGKLCKSFERIRGETSCGKANNEEILEKMA